MRLRTALYTGLALVTLAYNAAAFTSKKIADIHPSARNSGITGIVDDFDNDGDLDFIVLSTSHAWPFENIDGEFKKHEAIRSGEKGFEHHKWNTAISANNSKISGSSNDWNKDGLKDIVSVSTSDVTFCENLGDMNFYELGSVTPPDDTLRIRNGVGASKYFDPSRTNNSGVDCGLIGDDIIVLSTNKITRLRHMGDFNFMPEIIYNTSEKGNYCQWNSTPAMDIGDITFDGVDDIVVATTDQVFYLDGKDWSYHRLTNYMDPASANNSGVDIKIEDVVGRRKNTPETSHVGKEIIFASSDKVGYLYWDSERNFYGGNWLRGNPAKANYSIVSLAIADYCSDKRPEIIVASTDNIMAYVESDELGKKVFHFINYENTKAFDPAKADNSGVYITPIDINNDGKQELLFISTDQVRILNN